MADDPDIVPPPALAENALAIVRRLARTQLLPTELIAVLDGPLADAVAVAADYAGDAITATTRAAYLADWAEFAAWCRAQQVDPTALPIHSVQVAAYLAGPAGTIGRSALRRRVAANVYHHRRRGLVWSSQARPGAVPDGLGRHAQPRARLAGNRAPGRCGLSSTEGIDDFAYRALIRLARI